MAETDTDPWAALAAELDAWAAAGRRADLWWRDDDAVAPGPKLERLFDVTAATGLLLAVIPARAEDALGPAVAAAPDVRVGQHGYAHINHAPKGQGLGAWELGLHRGEAAVLAELDAGRERLAALFGARFLPVVVPPWNRIDAALFAPLAARGYRGVSAFGPRRAGTPGLVVANAQCDPIRWKEGARFAGATKALGALIGHLEARRTGTADADEPTGFLTHHIDLDADGWAFCRRLAATVEHHPAAFWRDPAELFGGRP
jgi:hypothetical protein